MGNILFSSQFYSLNGEQYKVDLFSESYEGFTAAITGGSGSVFYVSEDWTDFLTNGQPVLLDGVTADFINSFTYNSANNRTEITLQTSTYVAQTTIENNTGHGSSYIPDFDPEIIDIQTEWESEGDILLASIKASNTVITYANEDAWFDRFMDLYIESNDDELKLIIYKDNTGWELEWVGNIVIDLLEWDNASKPIPITIKAIDGLDRLKDIRYDDIETSPDDRPLNEHISRLLEKNGLSQFWGTLDPYVRESIEYISNEVNGSVTDFHSPLDYTFMHDRMFYTKSSSERQEGMTCYDALKAILELFNCRMFISKGVYYIQQVRNFDNATVIVYRQYTKSLNTYSRSTYNHKLDAGDARTDDMVNIAGGKFGYLYGLFRTRMGVRRNDQLRTYHSEQNISFDGQFNTSGDYQGSDFSLGTIDGGLGTGAYLTFNFLLSHFVTNGVSTVDVRMMVYQGGTAGIYRPINTASSGTNIIVSKEQFENFDLQTRCQSSATATIRDSAGSVILSGVSISAVAPSGSNAIAITLASGSYASNWATIETDDYTTTYFLTGGNGNPIEWVTMEHEDIFFRNDYKNFPFIHREEEISTTEIPFSGDVRCIIIGQVYGASGKAATLRAFRWLAPLGSTLDYNEEVEVENTNSGYTKELVLDPLNISQITTATNLNSLRVAQDYLTTNNPTLVTTETWDAGFDTDYGLNITRVAEAMSLQFRPMGKYMGAFEGQYYPHFSFNYHNKVWYFNGVRKDYQTDQVDGVWIEINVSKSGLTGIGFGGGIGGGSDSTSGDPDTTTGSGTDGLVAYIQNTNKLTEISADADAGTITSISIDAIGDTVLYVGDTIQILDPATGFVTEEFVVSADVTSAATSISVTSKVTTKNIKTGMAVQLKPKSNIDVVKMRSDTIQHKGNVSIPTAVTDLNDKELAIVGREIYWRDGTAIVKLTGTLHLGS